MCQRLSNTVNAVHAIRQCNRPRQQGEEKAEIVFLNVLRAKKKTSAVSRLIYWFELKMRETLSRLWNSIIRWICAYAIALNDCPMCSCICSSLRSITINFNFQSIKKIWKTHKSHLQESTTLFCAALQCWIYIGSLARHSVYHENGENCDVRYNRIKCLLLNHNVIMVLFASAKVTATARKR